MRRLLLTLLLLTWALALPARERIIDYHAEIRVQAAGRLLVEEQIKVQAEGRDIKRGIYRDFPTDYRDRLGNRYRVGFDLLGVKRDGRSEPYHTEKRNNGIRIYAGKKDIFLKPGIYTYTLSYATDRQLGFFPDHDELYWNVTGTDWSFPIERASARVHLPGDLSPEQLTTDGYTGPQGSRGQQYAARIESGNQAWFETTTPLGPREGLTIVLGWPKGVITEPDDNQQMAWFLEDNRTALLGLVGFLLILAYYLFAWWRVGRDPDRGVVIPLYEPPEKFSPASLRFINRMGYDHKSFSSALVNLAVKGHLEIREQKDGDFELRRKASQAPLAIGESAILNRLLPGQNSKLEMKQAHHSRIREALNAHRANLQRDYEKSYFLTNKRWLLPGTLGSIGLLIGLVLSLPDDGQQAVTGFMSVWLSVWSVAVFALAKGIWNNWKAARGGFGYLKAIVSSLFAIPFFVGEVVGIGVLLFRGSWVVLLAILSLLVTNLLFYEWMKAPTLAGAKLLQQVEGLKLYLSVAEQEELAFKHPPEKTPELFERLLPYAIALDVEQQWGERFTGILAAAERAPEEGYHPGWYHGNHWSHNDIGAFTGTLGGAMSGAIASSSTAPGSSSGGGGGGSSGGGGGGGGGGW